MKVGLALAGGGVRGAAHIGVIKALEENGIELYGIGGTSAGSMVAALYAMGYTPEEMLRLFKYFAKDVIGANPRAIVTSSKKERGFRFDGLLSSYPIEAAFEEVASYKGLTTLQDLNMKIAIPTTDIEEEKQYVFTNNQKEENYYIKDATIGKAVRASSSFPGIYTACLYENHKFVDGGVFNNLPTQEVKKLGCDKVISARFIRKNKQNVRSAYSIAMKSLDLIFDNLMETSILTSDYALGLACGDVNLLGINKIDYCYEIGYQETIKNKNKIKEMLEQ